MQKTNQVKIKVIGVGGAGCNAVIYLHKEQMENVQLIACNTDARALSASAVPDRLLLGDDSEQEQYGSGDPEKGKFAALAKGQDIKALLSDGTDIVFLVAGMGGSTGTGAAPIIAQIAKKLGVLTIGIATLPFSFEGEQKRKAAAEGINELKKYTDAVLVLANDKLRAHYGQLAIQEAFSKVDDFVANTVRAVADLLAITSEVNVDIEDIRTVLGDAGPAVVGSSVTAGENRAMLAAQEVLTNPLLLQDNIYGASKMLLSIVSGETAELGMEELTEIVEVLQEEAGQQAEILFGHAIDEDLGSSIRVTLIATGFSAN